MIAGLERHFKAENYPTLGKEAHTLKVTHGWECSKNMAIKGSNTDFQS